MTQYVQILMFKIPTKLLRFVKYMILGVIK